MEMLAPTVIRNPSDSQQSLNHPGNKYESLNHSELARLDASRAKKYKIAAYVAMGIGLVIFAAAVIVPAVLLGSNPITATLAAAGVFIFGLGIYNSVVKNKIFSHFRSLQAEAEANAQMHKGYAETIQTVKTEFENTQEYADWTDPQWNLKGMGQYWVERADQTTDRIKNLDKGAAKLTKALSNSGLSKSDRDKLENKLMQKLWQKHELTEGVLLSSRVHAAFFHYLNENPTETRGEGEFFSVQPISRAQADAHTMVNQGRMMNAQPTIRESAYLTLASNTSLFYSRHELQTKSIEWLSREIFGRQKVA